MMDDGKRRGLVPDRGELVFQIFKAVSTLMHLVRQAGAEAMAMEEPHCDQDGLVVHTLCPLLSLTLSCQRVSKTDLASLPLFPV